MKSLIPKSLSESFWLQFIPAMIFGFFTIALLSVGIIPLYYLIFTFVMWILVSGLGIAVGYHRVFSHKTYTLYPWLENIIMFFAIFAGQGPSLFWVAVHRGYHHPYADTDRDLHSPVSYSKMNSFVWWHYKITENNNPINLKYAVDLIRKPNHVWFHKHGLKLLWGIPILVAIFNWHLALTAFCLVTMIGILQDNLVNVFGHTKTWIGYRNFKTNDNSQNNIFLGYFAWGQGWHNNHHKYPLRFNFREKWWEFDPCVIFIPLLKLGSIK